eukprot:s6054_g1.t1
MRPSSALSSLPDELIQVLMHMVDEGLPPEFEHGFSPMHWSAQRGRRRIPLFFAERSGKVGLAYHLRRIGGSADLLVRSSEKRPDTEDLAPAYKKVLDQIEQRGWQSMKWKDDFTMLHWAASHGICEATGHAFQDPMMQQMGYPMTPSVPQMSPTNFPFSSPTLSGYGTDSFMREQILNDRVNQAQSRESQYQAQATVPTWSSHTTSSGWIDYSQWKDSDKSHQATWSKSWSSDWTDSKWTSKSQEWTDPTWGSNTSSWRSPDPPQTLPLDNRPLGTTSPPRTAYSSRRPPRRRHLRGGARRRQVLEGGRHVSLVDPSLKDAEWRQTVAKCLKDHTRTKAANEIAVHERPHLATTIDTRVRDSFIAQIHQIDPEIPPTRLQLLIHVLAASHLLSEVDFRRVEVLTLPNTSQRAMVVRLSHIPRFKEKLPFMGQASHSYAMLHGTNVI